MTKRYTISLKDEDAKKVDAILASKGMTMSDVVRKMFKLQDAVHLPWLRQGKVCQPGAAEDTQPTSEQESEAH